METLSRTDNTMPTEQFTLSVFCTKCEDDLMVSHVEGKMNETLADVMAKEHRNEYGHEVVIEITYK